MSGLEEILKNKKFNQEGEGLQEITALKEKIKQKENEYKKKESLLNEEKGKLAQNVENLKKDVGNEKESYSVIKTKEFEIKENTLKEEIKNLENALQKNKALIDALEEEKKTWKKELDKEQNDREQRQEALKTAIRIMKDEEAQKVKYENEVKKIEKIKQKLEEKLAAIEKNTNTSQKGKDKKLWNKFSISELFK